MDPVAEYKLLCTRRHLLGNMAGGIGAAALTDLLGSGAATASPIPSASDPLGRSSAPTLPRKTDDCDSSYGFSATFKAYDHKPELVKRDRGMSR